MLDRNILIASRSNIACVLEYVFILRGVIFSLPSYILCYYISKK